VQPLKISSLELEAKKGNKNVLPKKNGDENLCNIQNLSFGCNGANCHGSHSEATSKLQENQTTFAIFCQANNYLQDCLIILPRDGGDDHLQHR